MKERNKKVRFAAVAWSFFFVGMMFGGCGQNNNAVGRFEDIAGQTDIEEEWQEDENSL